MEKEKEDKHAKVGVFGIGTEGSKEEAILWLNEKLKILGDVKAEIYAKGDFNGILFAKFDSQNLRNQSVERFRKASLSRNGQRCWATEDSPIEERACKNFLFGVKNLLLEWNYGKFEIWVDVKKFEIYFGEDELIASVSVTPEKEMEFSYGEGWENYLREGKLDKIISKAKEMLSRSLGTTKGKGKNKGKSKSKSKSSSKASQ